MVGEVRLPSPSPRQPTILIAMSTLSAIPVERLWELYEYNPLTGEIYSRRLKRYLRGNQSLTCGRRSTARIALERQTLHRQLRSRGLCLVRW